MRVEVLLFSSLFFVLLRLPSLLSFPFFGGENKPSRVQLFSEQCCPTWGSSMIKGGKVGRMRRERLEERGWKKETLIGFGCWVHKTFLNRQVYRLLHFVLLPPFLRFSFIFPWNFLQPPISTPNLEIPKAQNRKKKKLKKNWNQKGDGCLVHGAWCSPTAGAAWLLQCTGSHPERLYPR